MRPTQPTRQWVRRGGGTFLGVKRPRCDVDRSLPSKAEVRHVRMYTAALPRCLHGVKRENFTLNIFYKVSDRAKLRYSVTIR